MSGNAITWAVYFVGEKHCRHAHTLCWCSFPDEVI